MKYIIDVPEDRVVNGKLSLFAEVESPLSTRIQTGIKCEPYTAPDRKAVENEVWELARKIADMGYEEFSKCFDVSDDYLEVNIMDVMTYSEAKAKYEAWKKEKDEIRVGDVIRHKNHYDNAIVTHINDGKIYFVYGSGDFGFCNDAEKYWEKTGHHFDEVAELLNKIKENK